MKKLKSFLILACSLVLSTFSLVGCFGDDSSDGDSSVGAPASSVETSSEEASSVETSSEAPASSEEDSSAHQHTGEYTYVSNGDGTHITKYACCGVVKNAYDVCEGGEADCENPAVCDKCATAYGEADGHEGGTATCKTKAVCDVCDQPYGEFATDNHEGTTFKYVSNGDGTHTKKYVCCEASVETGDCEGGTATCTAEAVCTVCETAYGEKLAHNPGENEVTDNGDTHSFLCAGCNEEQSGAHDYVVPEHDETQHWNNCICGKVGEKTAHDYAYEQVGNQHKQVCDCGYETALEDCSGGQATCLVKATCEDCGEKYGEFGDHVKTADQVEWTNEEDRHVKYCDCEDAIEIINLTNTKVLTVDLGIVEAGAETTATFDMLDAIDQEYTVYEATKLTYNGADVVMDGSIVDAKIFGGAYGLQEFELTIVSNDDVEHVVKVPVLVVTNVIETAEELKGFLAVADAVETDLPAEGGYTGKTWGGYFKLGANIDLNSTDLFDKGGFEVWNYDMNRKEGDSDSSYSEGFVGVFDGCGYAINGLATKSTAFIDVIGANGIVRNVSFTNAVVTSGASVVAEQNNGLIENVYVHMYSVGGWFNDSGTGLGQIGSWYNAGWTTANTTIINNSWVAAGMIKNALIDLTDSAKVNAESGKDVEGMTWHDDADGFRILGLSSGAKFEGVYVVGVPETGTWAETHAHGIVQGVQASVVDQKTAERSWYESMLAFKADLETNERAKAMVDALPTSIKYMAGLVEAQQVAGVQTLDLDVQVDNDTKAVSLSEGNVDLDLSAIADLGTVQSVLLDGAPVDYTVNETKLLISKAELGYQYGEKTFTVLTDSNAYEVKALLVTKVITTATDLDNFGYIAKAVRSDNAKMWGGYFQLGADIEFNNAWTTFIAVGSTVKGKSTGEGLGWNYANGGFEGVFDGNGHKLIGMTFNGWVDSTTQAFIGALKGGTVKNVAFTNTTLNGSGAVVTLGGEGTIENVYVHYTKFTAAEDYYSAGNTTVNTEGPGTFFSQVAGAKTVDCAITLKNCFVDLSEATLHATRTCAGTVGALSKWQADKQEWQGAKDYTGTMTNVYVIGGDKVYDTVYMDDATIVSEAELGNTTVYESVEAFETAYASDETLKTTYDALVALFGLNA